MTSEPELEVCPTCGALPCDWVNTPTTPATDVGEREAVALAMLNGKRVREGWPTTAEIPEGFIDADEWRAEAHDALSALAPIRAAETTAAHARGLADGVKQSEAAIVAWLRDDCPGCPYVAERGIANAIERREHAQEAGE